MSSKDDSSAKTEKLGRGKRQRAASSKKSQDSDFIYGDDQISKSIKESNKPMKKRSTSRNTVNGPTVVGEQRKEILSVTLQEMRDMDDEANLRGTAGNNQQPATPETRPAVVHSEEETTGSASGLVKTSEDTEKSTDNLTGDKRPNNEKMPESDQETVANNPVDSVAEKDSGSSAVSLDSTALVDSHVDSGVNSNGSKVKETGSMSTSYPVQSGPTNTYPPQQDSNERITQQQTQQGFIPLHTHVDAILQSRDEQDYDRIMQRINNERQEQQSFDTYSHNEIVPPYQQQQVQYNSERMYSSQQNNGYTHNGYTNNAFSHNNSQHDYNNFPHPQQIPPRFNNNQPWPGNNQQQPIMRGQHFPINTPFRPHTPFRQNSPANMSTSYNMPRPHPFSTQNSYTYNNGTMQSRFSPPSDGYGMNGNMQTITDTNGTCHTNIPQQNQNTSQTVHGSSNFTVLGTVDQSGRVIPASQSDRNTLVDSTKTYTVLGQLKDSANVVTPPDQSAVNGSSSNNSQRPEENFRLSLRSDTSTGRAIASGIMAANYEENMECNESVSLFDPSEENMEEGDYQCQDTSECTPMEYTGACSQGNSVESESAPISGNSSKSDKTPESSQSSKNEKKQDVRQKKTANVVLSRRKSKNGKGKESKVKGRSKKTKECKKRNSSDIDESCSKDDATQSLIEEVRTMVVRGRSEVRDRTVDDINEQVAINAENIETLTKMLESLHVVMQERLTSEQRKKIRSDIVWTVDSLIALTSERSTPLARLKVIIRALFNASELINHSAMGKVHNRPAVPHDERWTMMLDCAKKLGVDKGKHIDAVNAVCRQKTREFGGDQNDTDDSDSENDD